MKYPLQAGNGNPPPNKPKRQTEPTKKDQPAK